MPLNVPFPVQETPTQASLKIYKGKVKAKWGAKGFFSEVTKITGIAGGIAPKSVVVTVTLNAGTVVAEMVETEKVEPTFRLHSTTELEINTEIEVNWIALV